MAFSLSNRSKSKLEGVHPDLVKVVESAIGLTEIDFGVTYGVRSVQEQQKLYDSGRSQTMKSKHLILGIHMPLMLLRMMVQTLFGK